MRLGFAAWIIALAACSAGSEPSPRSPSDEPRHPSDEPSTEAPIGSDPEAATDSEAPGPDVSYAAAIAKSSHNSYERSEPLIDQLVYHRIRSVELDIHADKNGETTMSGDWFVYHEDAPFFRDTSCTRLSDCLGQLAAFHRAVPRHEVVTLWIDLKEGFAAGHGAAELDALLANALGRSNVLTPEDAKARCAGAKTLRDAVGGKCTWPTLADLRGKFVIATTGGSACDAASPVMTYDGKLAFRAPNFDAACTPANGDDVFVNLSWDDRAQATEARSLGLVTRMYKGGVPGGLDSKDDFDAAIAAGALHAATDKANADVDGWSSTSDFRGFPFRCGGCEGHVEPGTILGLRATSGDLWDVADDGFFAFAEGDAPAGEDAWTSLVSVPSSGTPEFAKACLVARASDAPGAAYAAACRTFDVNTPRMQVRATDGGATTNTTAPPVAGLGIEVPAFLRLRVKPSGSKTAVVAETSGDGKTWAKMGEAELEGALPLRGLVVSSHDAISARALFADPRRNGSPVGLSSLTKRAAIGATASGDAWSGVAP